MEGLYRLDANDAAHTGDGRGRRDQRGRAQLHLHPARRRQVVQRRPGDLAGLQVRLAQGARPRDGEPVRLHHLPVRGGATEYNAGEGSARGRRASRPPTTRRSRSRWSPRRRSSCSLTSFPTYHPQKQTFVEKQGEDYAQNADALLYNGPYTLTELQPDPGRAVEERPLLGREQRRHPAHRNAGSLRK